MPLILILAECGIEIIPKRLRTNFNVKKQIRSRNYSSQLLDNALHHSSMENLKKQEKRGRPDILHVCLLNALGSPLNKAGNLKIIVHTIKNKIFEFNPEIRIARNYNRFKGLMAKLLIDGKIGIAENYLISPIEGSLKQFITTIKEPEIILFSKSGKLISNMNELFSTDSDTNYVSIIGGFQKSSFSPQIKSLTNNLISISNYSLDASSVVSKVITIYELIHDIY